MEVDTKQNTEEPMETETSTVSRKALKDVGKETLCNGQDNTDDSSQDTSDGAVKINGKRDRETNGVRDRDHDMENSTDSKITSKDKDTSDADSDAKGKDDDRDEESNNEDTNKQSSGNTAQKEDDEAMETDEKKEDKSDNDEEVNKEDEKGETEESQDKPDTEEQAAKTAEQLEEEAEEKRKEEERLKEEERIKLEEKKLEEKRQKFKMIDNLGNDTEDMRPMAGLLYSLGADLAKQQIFKDLLRVQTKKKAKNMLTTDEDNEQLDHLKKTYEELLEKNKRFSNNSEICSRCQFKSESKNVMQWHLEFAHGTESGLFQCCFCDFYSKFPADFFFHVEQEHKRKGRIYMKPAFFCCPLCPFEHNSKAALNKHKPKCEKNFNIKRNLEPSPTDCDIPLKKLKTAVTAKPAKTVVQPVKTIAAKPTIAPATTSWQTRTSMPQVRMPTSVIGSQLPMPQMPVLQQRPIQPVVSQYAIGNNVYTLVNSQGQFMLHQAGGVQAGNISRAPGVGMVAPTALTSASGGMVRLQVPIVQVNNNQNSKSLLNSQTKSLLSNQAANKGTPSKSKSKSSQQTPPAGKSGQFEICEICGGFVKDRESLRIHFYWAHKVDINKELFDRKTPHLICEFCPQRFWTYQGYTRHRQMSHKAHNKDPVWKCPVCREDNIANLLTHLNQKHNISLTMICHQKYCPMCGLTFKNEPATKQHLFAAHKQMFEKAVAACVPTTNKGPGASPVPTGLFKNAAKTYEPVCSLCDMTFPSVEAFSLHCAKMHLFRCYRCGQKWNTAELLQAHFRQAHGNEQEKCQMCTSKLTIGRPYIRHLKRTHLKECSVVLVRLPKDKFDVYFKKYQENLPAPAVSPKTAASNTVKAVVAAVLKNTGVAKKRTGGGSKSSSVVIDLRDEDSPRKKPHRDNANKENDLKKENNIKQDEIKMKSSSNDVTTMEIDGETIVIKKQDEDSDEERERKESKDEEQESKEEQQESKDEDMKTDKSLTSDNAKDSDKQINGSSSQVEEAKESTS